MKVLSVVGTRPNFMKLAPLAREFAKRADVEHVVVHTGQHYDAAMSGAFFSDLAIPAPQHSLAVGPGSHAALTAAVLARMEPVLSAEQPDIVLVYGDVNSTIAAALAAAKMNLKVAHVEAGLRSRDRTMPEELNRLLTDQLADLLFAPSPDAVENLRAENVAAERIHFFGIGISGGSSGGGCCGPFIPPGFGRRRPSPGCGATGVPGWAPGGLGSAPGSLGSTPGGNLGIVAGVVGTADPVGV